MLSLQNNVVEIDKNFELNQKISFKEIQLLN